MYSHTSDQDSENAHLGAEEAEGVAAEGNKIELETRGLFFGSQRPLWNKIAVRNNEGNLDTTRSVSLSREHITRATYRFSFLKNCACREPTNRGPQWRRVWNEDPPK